MTEIPKEFWQKMTIDDFRAFLENDARLTAAQSRRIDELIAGKAEEPDALDR